MEPIVKAILLLQTGALGLPVWAQWLVLITVVVGVLLAFYKKVVRPAATLITTSEEMLPLLRELTTTFRGKPNTFKVLDEIAAQFRTDSGTTLRDVVNRLEDAADANRQSGEILKVGVEASRLLAEQDREQLQRLIVLVDRLTVRVDAGAATSSRIEKAAVEVADDLAAAHKRADDIAHGGDAGAAADAASRMTKKEKEMVRDEDLSGGR